MRKHEMIYVFYEKLPFYDLSSHKHKFLKEEKILRTDGGCDGLYGKETGKVMIKDKDGKIRNAEPRYDPPLPVSIVKEDVYDANERFKSGKLTKHPRHLQKGDEPLYDPPLPVSVVKEDVYDYTSRVKNGKLKETGNAQFKGANGQPLYDPPLPVSIVKEVMRKDTTYGDITSYEIKERKNGESRYDPPLPTTMLEIKSTRGKHSTEKPVALMEWVLKYYSKEGDVVLDPTMGSGSTGVACKNMNRNFIGIEMDDEIYEVAVNRIED